MKKSQRPQLSVPEMKNSFNLWVMSDDEEVNVVPGSKPTGREK